MTNPMKTSDGSIVRLNDLQFTGDWIAFNAETLETIHDSRKDGYDVDPLLSQAPVTWMEIIDGVFHFGLMTDLMWKED